KMDLNNKLTSLVRNTQRAFLEFGGLLSKDAQENGQVILNEGEAAIGAEEVGEIRMSLDSVDRLARQLTDAMMKQIHEAEKQDCKSAYRRLDHQYHPDKNQGDTGSEEKFKEAAEAYAVLSDPEQRQRYDRFGHAGVSSAASAAWGAPGFGNIEDILGDLFGFGDVFGAGARAGGRRSAAHRGAALSCDLV